MLFSSVVFILYFLPITLVLYYLTSFSKKLQNIILLVLSLIFYAWGQSSYVLIMVFSIVFNYILGLLIEKYKTKFFLIFGCICNLGILFVFKYLGFVIRNINSIQSFKIPIPNLSLPVGISFFTFKAVSYLVDVYKKKSKASKNPIYVGLYISFFPELLAGPISKYNNIVEQIKSRKTTWQKFSVGSCRFITGLSKKSSYIK